MSLSFYDSEKNCDWYEQIAKEYDATEMTQRFKAIVPPASKVLELGIGPGKDHDRLRETYRTVGSDLSEVFLKRYREKHPSADVRLLDAVSIEAPSVVDVVPFDAVFTNKVLHHLTESDFALSLSRQAQIVKPGGLLFHALWFGTGVAFHEGLRFQKHTADSVRHHLPPILVLESSEQYTEMEDNDSIVVVLRRVTEPIERGGSESKI